MPILLLKKLAGELNMTVRHLSRLFKSHTGNTIHAYREKIRVGFGEQLLLNSKMSIKEISDKCGFASPRQFYPDVDQSSRDAAHGIPGKALSEKPQRPLLRPLC